MIEMVFKHNLFAENNLSSKTCVPLCLFAVVLSLDHTVAALAILVVVELAHCAIVRFLLQQELLLNVFYVSFVSS